MPAARKSRACLQTRRGNRAFSRRQSWSSRCSYRFCRTANLSGWQTCSRVGQSGRLPRIRPSGQESAGCTPSGYPPERPTSLCCGHRPSSRCRSVSAMRSRYPGLPRGRLFASPSVRIQALRLWYRYAAWPMRQSVPCLARWCCRQRRCCRICCARVARLVSAGMGSGMPRHRISRWSRRTRRRYRGRVPPAGSC